MDSFRSAPKVSIALPVYNGEKTLIRTIDAILGQSYKDFELVISDNASTDKTSEICQKYAKLDKRIRYIRQKTNIGIYPNFRFVLDKARAEYFMWWAADDFKSNDFLKLNLAFLEKNSNYVACTSPNKMEAIDDKASLLSTFALNGNLEQRFFCFFNNCWHSHGIFYSLIRKSALNDCKFIGEHFFAADWAIILHLASKGKIKRLDEGEMISGLSGISSGSEAWNAFHKRFYHWFMPLYEFTFYTLVLSQKYSINLRLKIFARLLFLNLYCTFQKYFSISHKIYSDYIKKKLLKR